MPSLTAPNVVRPADAERAVRAALGRLGQRPRRVALVLPDAAAKVSLVRFKERPVARGGPGGARQVPDPQGRPVPRRGLAGLVRGRRPVRRRAGVRRGAGPPRHRGRVRAGLPGRRRHRRRRGPGHLRPGAVRPEDGRGPDRGLAAHPRVGGRGHHRDLPGPEPGVLPPPRRGRRRPPGRARAPDGHVLPGPPRRPRIQPRPRRRHARRRRSSGADWTAIQARLGVPRGTGDARCRRGGRRSGWPTRSRPRSGWPPPCGQRRRAMGRMDRINLSTRPFYNERAVHAAAGARGGAGRGGVGLQPLAGVRAVRAAGRAAGPHRPRGGEVAGAAGSRGDDPPIDQPARTRGHGGGGARGQRR